ncbi:MAG TPA: (deoxy)nucleoside triphosphate pyrophosphohydrolase [Terriglobales bacterium]|nr:(deoxy)nucleoside triphosphate pyrophosphohydrolase [Terriglobales bacterium]
MKQVVAAIMIRGEDKKILVCQRTKDQPLPLKWEFPGGKIEEGEEPVVALKRELDEELGIQAEIGPEVSRFVHHYKNGGGVELAFFLVTRFEGDIDNRIFKQVRWVDRRELPRFDFLEADIKLVKEIAAGKIV